MGGLCLILVIGLTACRSQEPASVDEDDQKNRVTNRAVSDQLPSRIGDIPLPDGFERHPAEEGSFTEFLRDLAIDSKDQVVHLYNGQPKSNQEVHYAILDLDVGNRDLQQCADAVMRIHGEFLFGSGRSDEISYDFTNGDAVPFSKYADGFRPTVNGNEVRWIKSSTADHTYSGFRKYMDLIFTYAGSYSLSRQLIPVDDIFQIEPGDVFIQGGFPGHAVIVLDVIINKDNGEKNFLLAQSYMPAQEIHVLKRSARDKSNSPPWYPIPDGDVVATPEWRFHKQDLKRFDIR